MKKLIRVILGKFGLDIVRSNSFKGDVYALNKNFENLVSNFESLFGQKFGEIPENETRSELIKDLSGTPPSEAYFIINSLHKTRTIEGEVCEFGVAQGKTSQLIANEIRDWTKKLHLFDSFEGLPEPTEKDVLKDDIFNLGDIKAYAGTISNPETLVRNGLDKMKFPEDRFVVHKGFIEELIKTKFESFPKCVSFAYVDFDFYEPIQIALDFLHKVSKKGAIFMIDDYDFFSTGAKTAVDEFTKQHTGVYEVFIPENIYGHFAILKKIRD
ncbi:TylF/MycF/NovP-related O-methyltransferase [uncultured Psychroserpens sp.]|uniref:TylF/MycF/NovP-related O-methyltransferase n=1 Tax=uncultured Psychroserpens sp. TaxID=255436 RepID=UPI002617E627|nr:TylF/MycF/NovP-related O-methyltransferase [uncultured Psychroserpens sp.]